jgi:hypothetical protein
MSWIRGLLAFILISALARLLARDEEILEEPPIRTKELEMIGIPSSVGRVECDHEFVGWREFADGSGGERVCRHCGMGAMEWSIRTGL